MQVTPALLGICDPNGIAAELAKFDDLVRELAEGRAQSAVPPVAAPSTTPVPVPAPAPGTPPATLRATALPSLRDGITFANQTHFTAPLSGEMTVWRCGVDHETGAQTVTPVSMNSVRLEFAPYTVPKLTPGPNGSVTHTRLADAWFHSGDRREYPGGVILQPEGPTPPGYFNLWQGFGVARKSGDPGPLVVLIYALCDYNRELAEYVLNWLAFCVQRPGTRPEVALVLRGKQGTGKGTLFRVMRKIFGRHGLHITQPKHLTGHFNAHLRYTRFLFVDEGFWAGDKEGTGVLKGLITEPTVAIEMKGHDVFTVPNMLAIGMASNSRWVVPAGADERRFCVADVSDLLAQDHAYFAELSAWIEGDGAAIFLDHLLSRDLSGFNVRAAPKTAALDLQKIEGMSPADRWILEALDTGTSLVHGEWTEGVQRIPCAMASSSFDVYCKQTGARGFKADSRTIGNRFAEVFGCGPALVSAAGHNKRERAWMLPGLTTARAGAAAAFGLAQYVWGAV
jgi:hypothetical protein